MANNALGKVHYKEYIWDFAVDGGATAINLGDKTAVNTDTGVGPTQVGDLPLSAVVVGLWAITETIVTSGGATTITLGTTDDADAWLASTAITLINAKFDIAGQANPVALVQCNDAASSDVILTVLTSNFTAGKIRFVFSYYLPSIGLS